MKSTRILTTGAVVLAITAAAYGQEKPFTQPGTGQPPAPPAPPKATAPAPTAPAAATSSNGLQKFFSGEIPDAIAKGKFSLNARLRFEYAEQDGVPAVTDPSYAPTIRTRFGYTTAPLYGFQGMIEGENVTALGPEDNYNAAGSNGQGDKPVIADPTTTELNQAWLGYTHTNLFSLKGGRQRVVLDNHRFVGDVGWRQNMQTFDAVSLDAKPVKDFSMFYSYVWDVHRVFGDVPGLPAGNRDFESDSHIINVTYSGCPYGRLVAYSYLLDLQNAAGAAQSSATYGAYLAGNTAATEKLSLGYRAEFAWQTDYADSLLDYEAEYYNLELSAAVKPFAFGAGYEVLGTDNNQGFRTPLATLHAFNGWADVFLATPPKGLRDLYGFAQVTLPWQVPVRFVYHKYDADSGGADLGYELDAIASRKFGKHWTGLVKYAYYDGKEAPAAIDVHKFWAQVEFNF